MKKLVRCLAFLIILTIEINSGFSLVAFGLETTRGADVLLNEMLIRGEPYIEKDLDMEIPNKTYENEEDAGVLPEITTGLFYQSIDDIIIPRTVGVGYVIGRVRTSKTASDGYIRKGYKKGTFSSIASVALSFIDGYPWMLISQILSVVGVVASDMDMVSGETLITYRYMYRDGEGRWSSDPNTEKSWRLESALESERLTST